MRHYIVLILVFLAINVSAQVMLPAYQGVQVRSTVVVAPTVTTTAISGITTGGATTGGNVTSSGGGAITARGVCWSYASGPTTADNTTTDGSGSGSFTSNPPMGPGADYYLRAYAINSAGTSYGSEVTFTTSSVALGDSYGGGYVAYIKRSGQPGYSPTAQHGLIIAPSDQSSAIQWYNGSILAISTTPAPFAGDANTTAIVAAQGPGTYAAKICYDLVLGGYSDWYLGSYNDMLNIMFNNQAALYAAPGFPAFSGYYWTSSNTNATTSAQGQVMLDTGTGRAWPEGNTYAVRAVRSF